MNKSDWLKNYGVQLTVLNGGVADMWIEINSDLIILLKNISNSFGQSPTEYVNELIREDLEFEDQESDVDNRFDDDGNEREESNDN